MILFSKCKTREGTKMQVYKNYPITVLLIFNSVVKDGRDHLVLFSCEHSTLVPFKGRDLVLSSTDTQFSFVNSLGVTRL